MIKKKVCMLGAFAAGKTSLVRQYVYGIFSEKYQTTVGVKIDKKRVIVEDQPVDLILWDLHGEDEFQKVRLSYLRGAAGCIFVADGTRRYTAEVTRRLMHQVEQAIGRMPRIVVFNKWDLQADWETEAGTIEHFKAPDTTVLKTSAKTGQSVETAFQTMTRLMLEY